MSGGFIVKDRVSIVHGPCEEQEALDTAAGLNAEHGTDAFHVAEVGPATAHLIPDPIDAHGDDFHAAADDRRDEWHPDEKDLC